MDIASTVVSTTVSVLLGGLITWYVSRKYYVDASKDLTEKVGELYSLTIIAIEALENAGVIVVERGAHGNPIKVHHLEASAAGTSTAEASLSVAPAPRWEGDTAT